MDEDKGLALVTGGSRGIGRAIASRLARDGFHVVLTYRSRKDSAEEVVTAIERDGGRAIAFHCNISISQSITTLFANVDTLKKPLAVVVANAAAFVPQRIHEVTDEAFATIIDANVRGPVLLARAASDRIVDGGRVIFLSSVAAVHASPTHILYSMSKAALGALIRGLAAEWGCRGITINGLMPGLTRTDMAAQLAAVLTPELPEIIAKVTALGRIGDPTDIASAASFLAGPDSGWVTGQTLECTGGYKI